MKKLLKYFILLFIIFSMLFILTGCGKFTSKVTWIDEGNDNYIQSVKIAVEKEGYKGKNIKEGTYKVKHVGSASDETTEKIYNVFISNTDYSDINNVPMTDWQGIVGGYGNEDEIEITVSKGQFVYLQTNNKGYNGYLEMKLK